ncbi:4'-phosphopantetheinyl transferase superfamily protein [Afipia sp. 1NLS2]|uniref:4'-phosphopantetheinyl transferase family protein n=1 Tax=Afipia sp. 1NLS2 TaxID=666684 RepID=UPI0002E3CF4B|nr:4'-phosphopantetheinyl transferase superfamily protein [Afipia sp. 1NLS2]
MASLILDGEAIATLWSTIKFIIDANFGSHSMVESLGGGALLDSVVWESPQSHPPLWEDEIHVWQSHLVADAGTQSLLHSYLSEDENERAARFRLDRDRNKFVTTRGTLRILLARYLQARPKDLMFLLGPEGKPALTAESAGEMLSFNVSHSQDVAVFAFGQNRNIGVDVERVRFDVEYDDIAQHYFSVGEMQSLAKLPRGNRREGFFLCWTRKEAYVKAGGRGLQIALDSFDVNLEPGDPACFLRGVHASWRISSFMVSNEYPVALVYDGAPADLKFFDLGNVRRLQ